jgi:hypothetical protein
MLKIEKIIVAILFLIVLVAFQYSNKLNYFSSQLDSAMMVENIESTYLHGAPVSQINASVLKAISTVIVQSAGKVCSQPLREESVETIAMFKRHAYGILYLLAPFRLIASGPEIAACFQAIAFTGFLLAIYLFQRAQKLSVTATLIFSAFVVAHPAWSESAFGQFYPDRFFILAGYVYLMLVYRRLKESEDHTYAIILVGLLASSLTERAAIVIGGSTLLLLVLFRGWKLQRKDAPLAGFAVAMLVYATAYMALVQENSDYGSFAGKAVGFLEAFASNPVLRMNLEKFLWVNLPYLIVALFEWRLALLAFCVMLPNMVGSIGGAEKTGWNTHYHSIYLPYLVAASGMGVLRIWKLLHNLRSRRVFLVGMALLSLYLMILNPYIVSPVWSTDWGNLKKNGLFAGLSLWAGFGESESKRITADYVNAVAAAIPENAVVSTTEGMMPAMMGKGRILHYYPLGLGNSDFVAVSFQIQDNGRLQLTGAYSYLGEKNLAELNSCLSDRIESEYKLQTTVFPGAATDYGTAIFKRKK